MINYNTDKLIPSTFILKLRGVLFLLLIPLISVAQKASKIEILNSNSLEFDETTSVKAKKLIGDVQLKHDGAYMFCDSAYIYSRSNTMDAYGHVKIIQGDSLQLFGDSLNYNANTRMAILRGNIRLVNKDVELTTSYLDYDRTKSVAYYYDGGIMVNQQRKDTLTSNRGYYFANSQSFFFKENVELTNPEYKILSDTLKYKLLYRNCLFLRTYYH